MKDKKKINEFNILFINIQFLFTGITLIALVVFLINPKTLIFLQFSIGFTLLSLALSNYKIYNKKSLTVAYMVVGILVLIYSILKLLGVL